jgi:8-oxo-dGTP pyrophosphatase MutT (NUDIX family)
MAEDWEERINGELDRRYAERVPKHAAPKPIESPDEAPQVNNADLIPIDHELMDSRAVYHGKIFDVREVHVRVNGKIITRQIVDHAPVVFILVRRDDGRYLIEHEYRAGVDDVCTGLPAGLIDEGEDPKHAAMRELFEETGFNANAMDVELMGCWHSSQGFTNEKAYVYRVDLFHPHSKGQHLDPDETISWEWVPWNDLYQMVIDGKISSAVAVSVIKDEFIGKIAGLIGIREVTLDGFKQAVDDLIDNDGAYRYSRDNY